MTTTTHSHKRWTDKGGHVNGAHKTMARNSLEYSFLPGQRLWAPDSYRTRTNACRSRRAPSTGRKAFLASSAKARQQWQLEIDLDRFE